MNSFNYASLEASKKLVDNGIVLETEAYWIRVANSPMMLVDNRHGADEYYPAPSMAEVWRELPEWTECKKQAVETKCVLMTKDNIKVFFSENPTDALIDLLIFVRKDRS